MLLDHQADIDKIYNIRGNNQGRNLPTTLGVQL